MILPFSRPLFRSLFALPILFCWLLAANASAQTAPVEAQEEAIKRYPELGVANSTFNTRFLQAYHGRRVLDPSYFQDPQWPVRLAEEIAANLGAPEAARPAPLASIATPAPAPSAVKTEQRAKRSRPGVYTLLMIIGAFSCAALLGSIYFVERAYRRKRLMAKYGDRALVNRMMRHRCWRGETVEQLVDSLGKPAKVDQAVFSSTVVETWKYEPLADNRFKLRVTVHDGRVVWWEPKKRSWLKSLATVKSRFTAGVKRSVERRPRGTMKELFAKVSQ